VKNISGLCGDTFCQFGRPKLNPVENIETFYVVLNFMISSYFPYFSTLGQWLLGVCVGVITCPRWPVTERALQDHLRRL